MTDREKLAMELEELVHLGSCAFVNGCHENLELADFILKREIEARIDELKRLQGNAEENGMFSRWEMLRKRIFELEKQLGVEDGKT